MGVDLRRPLFDDGYFLFGPRGWEALVWSSQILILAGDGADGMPRKLLFAELPTDPPGA